MTNSHNENQEFIAKLEYYVNKLLPQFSEVIELGSAGKLVKRLFLSQLLMDECLKSQARILACLMLLLYIVNEALLLKRAIEVLFDGLSADATMLSVIQSFI